MCERLYKYFMNTLSPEEAEPFELHLFECEQCRQNLMNLQNAVETMRENPESFRKAIRQADVTGATIKPVGSNRWVKFAIAASILFAFLYLAKFLFFDKPPNYELALLTTELEIDRFKGDTGTGDFATAIGHLQERRFDAAIVGFEHYLRQHPESYQANYYLGLAYLAADQPDWWDRKTFSRTDTQQSIRCLQGALNLAGENQYYQEVCFWLLAKAQLRLQEAGQAREMWQAILDLPSPDLIYKPEARKLLAQIGDGE